MHRSSVRPEDTRVEMTQIVLPSNANHHGTAFGGQIAAWCDISAAVAAQRLCRRPVVTASMDSLHFMEPVQRGMVVIFLAQVNQAWRTSMEVGVRVEAEDVLTGDRSHCCSAYLTFVALDDQGKPLPVPPLEVSGDPVAERRAIEADYRRELRLKMRDFQRSRP